MNGSGTPESVRRREVRGGFVKILETNRTGKKAVFGQASSLPDPAGARWNPHHGIAWIHNASGPFSELAVIHAGVLCRDQRKVKALNGFFVPRNRFRPCPLRMLASRPDHRDVRVIVSHMRAPVLEHFHEYVTGRLAF